jgi:hypothetical protein
MSTQNYFAIVVNGAEKFFRTNRKDAALIANKLRAEFGQYSVWIRPHFRLLSDDGSPVNL